MRNIRYKQWQGFIFFLLVDDLGNLLTKKQRNSLEVLWKFDFNMNIWNTARTKRKQKVLACHGVKKGI